MKKQLFSLAASKAMPRAVMASIVTNSMEAGLAVGQNGLTNHKRKPINMTLHLELIPLISVIAGVAVLMVPRLLRYIVGIYLIAVGILGMVS